MSQCFKGGHEFPIEDEHSAYCEQHGVLKMFKTWPLTGDGLTLEESNRLAGAGDRYEEPADGR